MLMAELSTLVKYKLPVKIIIIKNNSLGMIKWEQIVSEGNPQYGVDLQPIDFAAFARSCGAEGWTLEDPQDADGVLRDAFSHEGPALVEAVVDTNAPPMPGKITTEQAIHFAEALAKGQPDRWNILKSVVQEKIREVV
jgi:pyruvate dehydrogenase (quinone)